MPVLTEETPTRLFFVVDSEEDNEELYDTLEAAQEAKSEIDPALHPRIRVCLVRNAYFELGVGWNYDDYSDTFETIKYLEG